MAKYLEVAIENRRAALEIDDVGVQANACFYLVDALSFAARFPEALQMAEEGLARFPRHISFRGMDLPRCGASKSCAFSSHPRATDDVQRLRHGEPQLSRLHGTN